MKILLSKSKSIIHLLLFLDLCNMPKEIIRQVADYCWSNDFLSECSIITLLLLIVEYVNYWMTHDFVGELGCLSVGLLLLSI